MSRVTLHRIEKGEPAVAIGAYLNARVALGLDFGILTPEVQPADPSVTTRNQAGFWFAFPWGIIRNSSVWLGKFMGHNLAVSDRLKSQHPIPH